MHVSPIGICLSQVARCGVGLVGSGRVPARRVTRRSGDRRRTSMTRLGAESWRASQHNRTPKPAIRLHRPAADPLAHRLRHPVSMDLRWMTTVDADAVVAASHLFDYDARSQWTSGFLRSPTTTWVSPTSTGRRPGSFRASRSPTPTRGLRCSSTNSPSMSSFSDEASVTHS